MHPSIQRNFLSEEMFWEPGFTVHLHWDYQCFGWRFCLFAFWGGGFCFCVLFVGWLVFPIYSYGMYKFVVISKTVTIVTMSAAMEQKKWTDVFFSHLREPLTWLFGCVLPVTVDWLAQCKVLGSMIIPWALRTLFGPCAPDGQNINHSTGRPTDICRRWDDLQFLSLVPLRHLARQQSLCWAMVRWGTWSLLGQTITPLPMASKVSWLGRTSGMTFNVSYLVQWLVGAQWKVLVSICSEALFHCFT